MIINKKIIAFCWLFYLLPILLGAQISIPIGGQGGDEAVATMVYQDKIIIGGTFQQDLGNVWSRGGSDVFLQQYNLQGQLIWQYTLGSAYNEHLKALDIAPSGMVYSAGIFNDSLHFNAQDSVLYSSQQAIFIAKNNLQGQFQWATCLKGSNWAAIEDLISDNQDNIYITGSFIDTFLPNTPHQLTSHSEKTPFLVKMNALGQIVWSKTVALADEAEGIALSLTDQGELFWAGHFKGFFALQTDTIRAHWVYNDIFLAKMDSLGNYLLQQHYGGVYDNRCKDIAWHEGMLYIGGSFMGVLEIDQLRLVTAFRNYDAFIVQLNPDGTANWGQQSQTNADCFLEGFAFYQQQLVLGGVYQDSFVWQQENHAALEGQEAFWLILDHSGTLHQTQTWTGGGFDLIKGLATSPTGAMITVGGFQQDIHINGQTLQAQGFSEAFLHLSSPILSSSPTPNPAFELVKIQLQPNPAYDSTKILCSSASIQKWLLYNTQGQLVAQGNQAIIPCSKLAKGIYSVQVQTSKGIGIEKLIIP